jgi:hypothetical protein
MLLISFWLILSSITRFASGLTTTTSSYGPDLNATRRNAFQIINAVHSAMRQWGSSVNHNGVSFFVATVPEGNHFYHGRPFPGRPRGFEWLAFEVEHGYAFAQMPPNTNGEPQLAPPSPDNEPDIWRWQLSNSAISETEVSPVRYGRFNVDSNDQHPLTAAPDSDIEDADDGNNPKPPPAPPRGPVRNFFQIYRAERPLKLIYIDGMSAGKGAWGSTDSQDLLLVSRNSTVPPNDWMYGKLLCELAVEWGIDGWVRMEFGFEIVYCDFAPGAGLELVSQHGSPSPSDMANATLEMMTLEFEVLRAAAQRYHGMSSGRIQVDWSSMVSAFSYDVNLTNPNPERQDIPRLAELTKQEKEDIRARLREVVDARKDGVTPTVDWQGIVDQLITHFSDRLHNIARGNLSAVELSCEIGILSNPFLNYPADRNASSPPAAAVSLCTRLYLDDTLRKKYIWTPEDAAIYTAIEVVAETICSSLFHIRSLLTCTESGTGDEESGLARSQEIAVALVEQLKWTNWKECGRCPKPGQICLIPMFPYGSSEDYYSPRCRGLGDMEESFKGCYWRRPCHGSPTGYDNEICCRKTFR